MSDVDAGFVEFVTDGPAGPPDGDRGPRRRWPAVLAGALVVAALSGAWLTTRADGPGTVPRPSPSVSEHTPPPVVTSVVPYGDLGPLVALHYDPRTCPVTIECTRSATLPPAALVALTHELPGAVVVSQEAVTQTNPPRIYYRSLVAAVGTARLTVEVFRSDILDGLAPSSSSGPDVGFVRVIMHGFEVDVTATGRPAARPPLVALRALAADPGLLVLPGAG